MLLLQANHVSKSFGDRLLFAFDRLEIHSGDRIGLVGVNGVGKSTLLAAPRDSGLDALIGQMPAPPNRQSPFERPRAKALNYSQQTARAARFGQRVLLSFISVSRYNGPIRPRQNRPSAYMRRRLPKRIFCTGIPPPRIHGGCGFPSPRAPIPHTVGTP